MRYAHVFDDMPPLFQTFVKVLMIATRKGFYKLPRTVLWEVLNDLVAECVESSVFAIVLDEMIEMCLLKIEKENDEEVVFFQSPALADIAHDVSTPKQINSIVEALIERLEPITSNNFKIPFVLANLHNLLGRQEATQKHLWLLGYKAFLSETKNWRDSDINRWEELIECEIEEAGYDAPDILGEDFEYPPIRIKPVNHILPLLKMYSGPIAFGPMSHSFSVICRNTFHEFGVFHGTHCATVSRLRRATASASSRYLNEMEVIEDFLLEYGLSAPRHDLQNKMLIMKHIAAPAKCDEHVEAKAFKILDEFVPRFVETRIKRLHSFVDKLRKAGMPCVMKNAPKALRGAYEALQGSKNRIDAAQDALMILATMNWRPKPVPEYLPSFHFQTVARLRSKMLRRLTDAELIISRQSQSVDDLEAFLIVTSLLYAAQDSGKCRCV